MRYLLEQVGDIEVKGNFHAHTKSYKGLTFGVNTEQEMIDAYKARGYDVIGLSNYHKISDYLKDDPLYIPIYEHGINLFKVHNLVLGSKTVALPGFPIHFSLHQTQQMLERTGNIGSLNVLAHPTMSRLPASGMSKLTGYNLMEVGNTLGMSLEHWDSALSAGRPVWILSNDDTHGLLIEPTFVKWNIMYPKEANAASTIEALRRGSHYGVEAYREGCENYDLVECKIRNDTLVVKMSQAVNRIYMKGQNGEMRAQNARSDQLTYALQASDTYVRTEIYMENCVYYLNPIVRQSASDGVPTNATTPQVNQLLTWLVRFITAILLIACIWFVYRAGLSHLNKKR